MRSLEETLKDAERWNGLAPGSLERDVLYHLREYKNAVKELDKLKRMYKRELRAAEEIRMKK